MMNKAVFVAAACAAAFACNKTEQSTTTTSGSSSASTTAATATATTTAAQPGIVDKALSFLGGGGPFEGAITMNNTSGDKPSKTMTYEVKGTKMRFDAPEERGPMSGGYVIFDTTAKKMTVVNDAKKTAMVMDVGAMGATPAGMPPAGPKPTVEKTGKTDTVAGYSCDVWKVTEASGEKTEACVAKGISFPAFGRHAGWMSSLEDGFPLRAISYDSAGKEKSKMEVTKIDKKSIDDSQFQVPAGYTTQDMASMMRGLGGMGVGGFRPPR